MELGFTSEQLALEAQCCKFAEKHIVPHIKALEEDLSFRLTLFQKMAQMGLFLLCVPKDQGGTYIDTISYILALKAIAKADAGISVAMTVTNMVAEAISRFGTEEQKKKYFSQIAKGIGVPFAFALTEKNAGSDIKAIQTEALWNSSENLYLLNGEKQFISNGDCAGALIVIAKTKSHEDNPLISAFLIEGKTPGLTVKKKENKLGLLTANLVTLSFNNCRVPLENLLGKEGEGLKIALSSLDSGRTGIAAQANGISEAAFEAALAYAKQRYQFGHALVDNQAIAFKLADMRVQLNAAHLMAFQAAWFKDSGKEFSEASAEAKLFCSETCNRIANDALQIYGGYGYIKDYPVEKFFRDARVTTLYEGTSEIQRIVISRHLLSE